MKILTTGGNGYIGSALVKLLSKIGHEVISFDKSYKITKNNQFRGDLVNKKDIEECFSKYKNIDLTIHLAALSGIEQNINQYLEYINNNILGTYNLLETMREFNVKKILFSSSCACYGNNQNSKEWDDLKPESIYGLSKLTSEEFIKFYGRNYGFNYNIFRVFNTIGRSVDSEFNNRRLIPTLINNITSGLDINLFIQSNKKDVCVRDYVYLGFVCEVFSKFIEKPTNKIINIGSGKGVSGGEMANKMLKLLNKNPADIKINKIKKRIGDPDKSISNNERLEKLGFKYNKSIEEIARE